VAVDGGGLELRTFLAGPGGTYEGVHEGVGEEASRWAVDAAQLARRAVEA
jgi:hypothetical protein